MATKPWWQTTKTARQGFWMGSVFVIVGLGGIALDNLARVSIWHVLPHAVFLLIGSAHLASAVALRMRQRTLPPSS